RRAAYPRLPIRVKQPLEALARTPAPLGEIADDAGDTKPLPLGARTAQMLHDCHVFTSSDSRLPSSTKSSVRYSRSAHSVASRVSACTSTSCRGTPASHEALTSSVHIFRLRYPREKLPRPIPAHNPKPPRDYLHHRGDPDGVTPLLHLFAALIQPAHQISVPDSMRQVPQRLAPLFHKHRYSPRCTYHYTKPCPPAQTA